MPAEHVGDCAVCIGGASGIGRATALALAAEGARVVVGDADEDGAEETARLVAERGGVATAAFVDVADEHHVERFIAAAVATYGPLSCAANVAGTHAGLGARTADVTVEDFDRQIAVNLRGMWLCVRAELRAMLARGGGAIVNVSSVNGLSGAEEASPYSIAKHGILGLTKSAALEYATRGIAVNAVAPGLVDTPLTQRALTAMNPGDPQRAEAAWVAEIPAARMATSEEIADAITWLCTKAPPYLTGATLVIDGAFSIRG